MTAPHDSWRAVTGTIFNVQPYSIHDGPGIRTTIFLKGCPLNCWWCQNPEARACRPQLFFDAQKCAGCGACVDVCPVHAISLQDARSRTDRALCNGSGHCVEVCPHQARTLMGREITAGDAFDEASADVIFFSESGGGITLSGGEPLRQPEFAQRSSSSAAMKESTPPSIPAATRPGRLSARSSDAPILCSMTSNTWTRPRTWPQPASPTT